MTTQIKLAVAVALLLGALAILLYTYGPSRTPGAGKAVDIYNPATKQRASTTMDQIVKRAALIPPEAAYISRPDTSGWKCKFPGTNDWGWVVQPGQSKDLPMDVPNLDDTPPKSFH